jgi:hypothetical protein
MISREDIEFTLSHFESDLFPRKMMTLSTSVQFSVTSAEEIYRECKYSDFKDCRINAYPEYTDYKGIVRQPPNFVFIDLDLANFEMSKNKLELRLKRTLKKIKEYKGFPTALWTGNGYHIYLPIKAIVLDQEEIFSKDKFPNLFSNTGKYSNRSVSEVFLKYAEIFFTNGTADPQHVPTYKSCLIRIPNSYNSKLLQKGISIKDSKVEIIQRWDGHKIPIQLLLRDFRRWLIQEEYNQMLSNKRNRKFVKTNNIHITNSNTIVWIEELLQTPLNDHRKYCLFHVLVPYLLNVRNLSHVETSELLEAWLSKCNQLSELDFNPSIEIRNRLKYAKDYKPVSLSRLKNMNFELHHELKHNGISV